MDNARQVGDELVGRWSQLRVELGWDPAADAVAWSLIGRYAEPHRRYHGVSHLVAVLHMLEELCPVAELAPETKLAAWFHDAVYDPAASDNEERSRDLATATISQHDVEARSPAVRERFGIVSDLILATKTHVPVGPQADVLLDADLSILGAPAETYRRYAAAIRHEYAHVPDAAFRAGRRTVLEAFLARPTLFCTTAGRARFDGQARINLATELAGLTEG